MGLLDNIEKSRVDVQRILFNDDVFIPAIDKDAPDVLFPLYRKGRIWVSVFPNNIDDDDYDSLRQFAFDVKNQLHYIPEVKWTSPMYLVYGCGRIYDPYIGIDIERSTPNKATRILCSILSIFCRFEKGIVLIVDLNPGNVREWWFTALSLYYGSVENLQYDDYKDYLMRSRENKDFKDLLELICGRPIGLCEYVNCAKRVGSFLNQIRQ